MRHPALIAFGVTTAVLVPAGLSALNAGPAERAKLYANRSRSLILEDAHVDISLDRNFANEGNTVHLKLVSDKPTKVAVVVVGTTGNEAMRTENPPRGIAHETVELAAAEDGTISKDVPIVLEGASPQRSIGLGHYTFYVMAPDAADKFERWRKARTQGQRDVAIGDGHTDVAKLADMLESSWAPIEQPRYKLRSIASVDAYTRTYYSGLKISAPNRVRRDEEFVATVEIKNPRKQATTFEVNLETPWSYDSGDGGDSGEPVTVEERTQSVALAPGETRKIEFKVTGTRRTTLALHATVTCGDGCTAYENGAFEAVDVAAPRARRVTAQR